MKSNLLNEAIADAKAVRETAVQTAISRLKETFEPTVRKLITQKLSEENDEDDDDYQDPAPAPSPEPEPPVSDDDDMTEEYEDDDMTEEYEDDEFDLEEILRELEGEDDMGDLEEESTDDYDEDPAHLGEADEDDDSDVYESEDDDISMSDLEEILRELSEEEDEGSEKPEPVEPQPQQENRRLRRELSEAKSELKKAYKAIATQKRAINEVNLLNSKLLFMTKITNAHKVSPEKQIKILEAFDRAQTIREVKLVYATIKESMSANKSNRSLTESASKPIRAMKRNLNENFEFASRWKELAGIK
jgi:hypothetical protein